MIENEIQAPMFEFTGNHLCLDFCNTVHDRTTEPREMLNCYENLLAWGEQARLVTPLEAAALCTAASQQSAKAEMVRQRAIQVREALYRIFRAIAGGEAVAPSDLDTMNAELARSMAQACIVQREQGFVRDWRAENAALDFILWPVMSLAADLLTSEQREWVRVCAADDCSWLFLDSSKNHSRRWCDMKSCGNRAKARRHYQQKKQPQSIEMRRG